MFSILKLLLVQQRIRSSIASPDIIGLNVFMAITNTSDPEDKAQTWVDM